MRKLTLSYFIILIVALISVSIIAIAIPVLAQENEVETALLEFNNKFLPGVDNYQTQIKYPKSSDYYFKWTSLVIAVGEDTAFILTAGRSETVVKIVDATIFGGKVVQGKVAEAAVNFAVGEAVDYGAKKAVGKKIPGYRSGVAVYGILKAGEEEQEKIFESIAKQREIQEFIGEIAPAVVELQEKIKSIESPDKRKEYQEMLSAMLQKKAKLSVYREMQFDKNEANISGLEYEILYSINPATAAQFANGKLTSSWQLSNSVNDYAAGRINKYQLIEHIKDYMRSNHGNEPLSYTESMMDKRLKSIQGKLDQIDKAYEAINEYGGSTVGDIKEISSYRQLKIVIPKAYRVVSNLDVRNLVMIPGNFKSSEPNQGTTIITTEVIPKYLRKDDASQAIMKSEYEPTTKDSAFTILSEYKSIPGGVILEGIGTGIGNVQKALFNASDNSIVLDGGITYEIPVTRQEMKDILLAISKNDKMGVSLVDKYIVYGGLDNGNNITLTISLVDLFLAHIVYGGKHEEKFGDYKFANGYVLKKFKGTLLSGICVYFRFCDYEFRKNKTRYELASSRLAITLVPTKKEERADDGGALPDFNAIEKGYVPDAWKQNAQHISKNIDYYMKERLMRMVNCYGEAAAFARALKGSGIDLEKLAASL